MRDWYVIKTKPKQEQSVLGQLSRAGYEMFLPQMAGLCAPKPLFPSYLFVSADLSEVSHHRLIRFTRGVSQILGDQSNPIPVADDMIQELKSRTRDGHIIEQELLFGAGDSVRVKRGVLKDLIGMIEGHLSGQKRVQILFQWMQTSLRAKLKYTDLEKVS